MSAFPYEWLGVLALAILWTNVLLIAGAALAQRRSLAGVRAELARARREGSLVEGVVAEARGEGGVLAVRRVEQLGRAMTIGGPDRILFTDRTSSSESFGGAVIAAGGARTEIAAGEIDLWLPEGARLRRASDDFDLAWSRASTNKGFATRVEQAVSNGDRVFVLVRGDRTLIAATDPVSVVARRRAMLAVFAALAVLGCAGVTVVACWPPALGTVSTLGGMLGVAYFLAIQPLGTRVRDEARLPSARLIGGVWQRP